MERTCVHDGKEYVILWRKTVGEPTERCVYCNRRHYHGYTDGPKSAQCPMFSTRVFVHNGKTYRSQADGYFVKTIGS